MRTTAWGCGFLLLVVFGAVGFTASRSERVLGDGSKIVILGTSFGREHLYPSAAGTGALLDRAVPPGLREKMGWPIGRMATEGNSLVLFLERIPKDRSKRLSISRPEVKFPDGAWVAGGRVFARSNVVGLEFPIYPRAERWLTVRWMAAGEPVEFAIRNRGSRARQEWSAIPLPQTNGSAHTKVTLSENRAGSREPMTVRVRSGDGGAAAGWMTWEMVAEDAWGNWLRRTRGRLVRSDFDRLDGPIKLTVRPYEYLSAGMIRLPVGGEVQALEVLPRCAALGLKSIHLLGPGTFVVTNGTPVRVGLASHAAYATDRGLVETNRTLQVNVAVPSLLLMMEADNEVALSARLRERLLPKRDGRTFGPRATFNHTNEVSPSQIAQLLQFEVRSQEELLEAEIVAAHRRSDFFIGDRESAR